MPTDLDLATCRLQDIGLQLWLDALEANHLRDVAHLVDLEIARRDEDALGARLADDLPQVPDAADHRVAVL